MALLTLVPAYSFMDLLVLDQVSLLAERLATNVAPERLLTSMCPQMNLYVALVEETPVTDGTPVYGFLLATD